MIATSPPPAPMLDLGGATRSIIEECTNELDAIPSRASALTFAVALGNGLMSQVRCTRNAKGEVHASITIVQVKGLK